MSDEVYTASRLICFRDIRTLLASQKNVWAKKQNKLTVKRDEKQ